MEKYLFRKIVGVGLASCIIGVAGLAITQQNVLAEGYIGTSGGDDLVIDENYRSGSFGVGIVNEEKGITYPSVSSGKVGAIITGEDILNNVSRLWEMLMSVNEIPTGYTVCTDIDSNLRFKIGGDVSGVTFKLIKESEQNKPQVNNFDISIYYRGKVCYHLLLEKKDGEVVTPQDINNILEQIREKLAVPYNYEIVGENTTTYNINKISYYLDFNLVKQSNPTRKPSDKPLVPDENARQVFCRLYNPNSGQHHYTTDSNEAHSLASIGWKLESEIKVAPVFGDLVYRAYNPNNGDHHYTMSKDEINHLAKMGWKDEGVAWYSVNPKDGVPVYRVYNPNAKVGTHHWTADAKERDHLVSLGWKDEGISYYQVRTK